MTLHPAELHDAAASLFAAQLDRAPIPPLSSSYPDLDPVDAYAIQQLNVDERLAAGERIVGHKIGLTSRVMQEMLGVSEPDYGVLFEAMVFADGAAVAASSLLQPRVEVETAFTLARPLRGPGVTVADVLAATASVAPSIEIIDSRIADWKITLADTIADNASSAGIVVGSGRPLGDLALEEVTATLELNGEQVASGSGADVLGHPAAAVAWLANKLSEFDHFLDAGEVVMPGSCTKAVAIGPGDEIRAVFEVLGSVHFHLVSAAS